MVESREVMRWIDEFMQTRDMSSSLCRTGMGSGDGTKRIFGVTLFIILYVNTKKGWLREIKRTRLVVVSICYLTLPRNKLDDQSQSIGTKKATSSSSKSFKSGATPVMVLIFILALGLLPGLTKPVLPLK